VATGAGEHTGRQRSLARTLYCLASFFDHRSDSCESHRISDRAYTTYIQEVTQDTFWNKRKQSICMLGIAYIHM
jgi:hypothetical protein